jgi:hypothetical protein
VPIAEVGNGTSASGSIVASLQRNILLGADAEIFSIPFRTLGMPSVLIWVQTLAGALPTEVYPYYSVRSTDAAGAVSQDWLRFPPFLVPGTSTTWGTTLNLRVPADFVRLGFVRPAGQGTTLKFAISASI